jgi:hypothetical protein
MAGGFQDRFKAIIARQSNEQLMSILAQYKDILHDWRSWGENTQRYTAEEAHKRGLIA